LDERIGRGEDGGQRDGDQGSE